MDDKNKKWAKPDYEGWQDVTAKFVGLPPKRFYFVVTMLTMASVAYLVSDSLWALTIVMTLMLVFAISVFLMHWRSEGDGQKQQDGSAESSDYDRTARENRSLDGDFEFREHDGHSPSSPSGLRILLDSQEEKAADNHP